MVWLKKGKGVGWASGGNTAEKSALLLADLREAARTGKQEIRLSHRRAKRDAAASKKKVLEQAAKRDSVTFTQFFENSYFPTVEPGRTYWPNGRERSLHKRWLGPVIGNKPLKDISSFDLERIKKNMAGAGQSPRSIHYALAVVRQVFNFAIKGGRFNGSNPVGKVKIPKYDNRRQRFLSHAEAEMLLSALQPGSQVYNMALLALHTGVRAGEVFSLTWGDVDTIHGLLNLRDTKSGRNRTLHMTTAIKGMFVSLSAGKANELVFVGSNGKKIKEMPSAFKTAVQRCDFNHGVDDHRQKVTFHTLRHTFASWSVMAGIDIYVLQKILGHSTITMTERYAHLAPNKFKAAVEIFEQDIVDHHAKQKQVGA